MSLDRLKEFLDPGHVLVCPQCGRKYEFSGEPGQVTTLCLECGEVLKVPSREEPPAEDRVGRYRIIREIASGGMGVVYEAKDESLDRRVAVKILREGVSVRRFYREAAMAAGLRHNHIITIHEVGSIRDPRGSEAHFICMDYVDGPTLAGAKFETRPMVEIIEKVARAVHHAHGQGIIHRDLKPGNILITPEGEPILTDFGLARDLEAQSKLTATGATVGTPAYMAPEQIRGEETTTRTDVYALGTILYEAVAGRLPFQGGVVAEIHRKILEEEPALHTDPALRTIVLKAMAKDPERRYGTALDLADDLHCWLAGEPISARPPSFFYLFRKTAWKLKLWGAALVLAVAILILLPTGPDMDDLREKAVLQLELVLTKRRVGDLAGMKKHAEGLRETCAQLPHPDYWLGRLHRVFMNFDAALAAQQKAIDHDPEFQPARYERGILRLRQFVARMEELDRRWHEKPRMEEHPKFRAADDPVLNRLREQLREDLSGALLSWVKGEDAAAALEQEIQKSPFTPELYMIRARIGDAVHWYTRGIERDRGYLPFYVGRAEARREKNHFSDAVDDYTRALDFDDTRADLWLGRARNRIDAGDPREALKDVARALKLDKESAEAWMLKGGAHLNLNEHDQAVEDLEHAVGIDRSSGRIWMSLATAYLNRGKDKADRKADSWEDFERGEECLTQATKLSPRDADVWGALGGMHINRGMVEGDTVRFEKAITAYDESIAIRDDPVNRTQRGQAKMMLGLMTGRGGGEGWEDRFRDAMKDFDKAYRMAPRNREVLMLRGSGWVNWANILSEKGRDPHAHIDKGLEDFDRAVKLFPDQASVWASRGTVHGARMNHLLRAKKPAEESYERMKKDFAEAIRLTPEDATLYMRRGQFHDLMEKWKDALADYDKAIDLNGRLFSVLRKQRDRAALKARD